MEVPAGKLKLSKVPKRLWTYLIVDFITKLPLVTGKNVILVVCNRLSKITHFVAITEGISVEGLARLFRDSVWKLHGLCYELRSLGLDNRTTLVLSNTRELNRDLFTN